MTTVRMTHPVDPAVRARVMAELAEVERRHDVRVLFACESGSRGWGFASPDSDYDVRFVYAHRRDWYLSVEPQRDVIERPLDDEPDVSGWELRKALQLLRGSNPTLLEWLDSPVVYREDARWAPRLRSLASAFFSPVRGRHHYLAMAKKNFRSYLQGDTV
ncbi:nucleotidyltransferase, partial [Pseudomonas sp. MWU13-2860]